MTEVIETKKEPSGSAGKVLYVGDAVAKTGFARATMAACTGLKDAGWDVTLLGMHYDGDPHDWPFTIYPGARNGRGEDPFGVKRLAQLVALLEPDLVILQNDPWNIPDYVRAVRAIDKELGREKPTTIAGWIAVDGLNCQGRMLEGLTKCVFWTEFGAKEAQAGGYDGETAVVPLGVDLHTFWSRSTSEARRMLGESLVDTAREMALRKPEAERPAILVDAMRRAERLQTAFVLGSVGRNQPRKRLDLTLAYFAEWLAYRKSLGEEDTNAQLLLHVAPTGDLGWDLRQMGDYYGLRGRVILQSPDFYYGCTEEQLGWTYAAMDAYFSTTQGEGMGLTALEAMAAGVACILPDWSAYGDWAKPAALLVPCTTVAHTPKINVVGGVMDRRAAVEAIDLMYRDRSTRSEHAKAGLTLAREKRFRWEEVSAAFAREMERFVPANVTAVPQAASPVAQVEDEEFDGVELARATG